MGYYSLKPGTPVGEVLKRWSQDGDKAYDDSMPQLYSPRELWAYREYTWTRQTARAGNARVKGKTVWLEGPVKWDALVADMKQRGWDPSEPLHMKVGKNGKALVGEGNHRLAIAMEAKVGKVPVVFHFEQNVSKTPEPEPTFKEVPSKTVEKVVERYVEKEPISPKDKEQIDQLMDLLKFSGYSYDKR